MADCPSIFGIPDPICELANLGGSVAGNVAGSAIDAFADAVVEAVGKTVATLGTLWVEVGTPNLTTRPGGTTPSDTVGFLQGSLLWYMLAAAVLSVIIGGTKMAYERKAEPGRELVKALMRLILVSGAGLATVSAGVVAADAFAKWVIDGSIQGTDFGANITTMLGLSTVNGMGALLVILLGLAAIFASLFQIALMIVRGGALVLLTGTLNLSASATNTEMGMQWFKKNVSWLVGFILYKPAAAIVYATAFRLSGADVFGSGGLLTAVTGLVLIVLAILALPALMRLVTPLVGAVTSGGGGGGTAAAAGALLPTGAMMLASGGGGGGGGGSTGGGWAGPSGASGVAGGRGSAGSSGSSPPTPGGGGGGGGGGSNQGGGSRSGGGSPVRPGGTGAAASSGSGAAAAAGGPVGAGAAAGATAAKAAGAAAQNAASSAGGESASGAAPSGSAAAAASGGGSGAASSNRQGSGSGAAATGAGPAVAAGAAAAEGAAQAARRAASSQTGEGDGPSGSK